MIILKCTLQNDFDYKNATDLKPINLIGTMQRLSEKIWLAEKSDKLRKNPLTIILGILTSKELRLINLKFILVLYWASFGYIMCLIGTQKRIETQERTVINESRFYWILVIDLIRLKLHQFAAHSSNGLYWFVSRF